MRDSILNIIRENGIISFNDIIYALNLQTKSKKHKLVIHHIKRKENEDYTVNNRF